MREVGDGPAHVFTVDEDDEYGPARRADAEERRLRDARRATLPATVAARAMLRMAAGARLDDLGLGPRFLIFLVPDPAWAEHVLEAFRLFAKGGRPAARPSGIGEPPDDPGAWCALTPDGRRGNLSAEEAARALLGGVQVVGATHDLSAVPPALANAADRIVEVGLVDLAILRHVAEAVCGPSDDWPAMPLPSKEELAAIGPTSLALAVRPDDDAPAYAERVLRIARGTVRATAKVEAAKPLQGLARVPGLGPAVAWGRSLAADLRAYAAGDLPWSAVDRGALLVGPPGVGKTTFAAALAEECGMALVIGNHGIWQAAGHQGDALKAMRKTFAEAREQAPCLLFIDEVDSFPDRSRLGRDHGDYLRPVINALLAELDGAVSREGVVVLAACNDAGNLDPALLRAGRLERVLRVALPDVPGREEILRVHLGEELRQADLHQVARLSEGMSGADLEKAVREARRAARVSRREVMLGDLVVAVAEARGIELLPSYGLVLN